MALPVTNQVESLQPFALQDKLVGRASEAVLSNPRCFGMRRFAGAVLAATTLLSGCAAASASSPESEQTSVSVTAETTTPATTSFEFSMQPAPATTGSTVPTPASTEQLAPVSPLQPVSAPDAPAPFTLTLNTHLTPAMAMIVYPKHVEPGTPFKLDEPPNCSWETTEDRDRDIAAGTVAADCDWSKTTAWADNSPFPQIPSAGQVDVGGHNCITRLNCGFSGIARIEDGDADSTNDTYNVTKEDTITELTSTGQITLQVCGISTSNKYPQPGEKTNLPTCTVKDTSGNDVVVKPDLMIGTCLNDIDPATGEYYSETNIYIAAKAIASEPVPAQ